MFLLLLALLSPPELVMKGSVHTEDATVYGTVYVVNDHAALDAGSTGSCTPFEESSCYSQCYQQVNTPFCTVMSSGCAPTGGGGVSCSCSYFCANSEDGSSHRPDEGFSYPRLATVEPEIY